MQYERILTVPQFEKRNSLHTQAVTSRYDKTILLLLLLVRDPIGYRGSANCISK